MHALSSRWKQLLSFSHTKQDPLTTPSIKNITDIDSSALKSVIKPRSPKVVRMTHPNDMNVQQQHPIDINSGSLLDIIEGFIQSTDTVNEIEDPISPVEKLPTNLLIPSTLALSRSSIGGGISIVPSTLTSGSISSNEFHDKWPIPDSIDQVKSLCESERLEGSARSQLALCLHLMESAWKVDPENSMVLSPVSVKPQPHHILSNLLPNHIQHAPNTLGEAMVMEARQMLKQLANSSQNPGQSGDAEAQFLLGSCYGMGALGWPINHYRAFQWYNQASKQNHAEATYRTAVCYELGIGTERDGDRAITYYKKASHLLHAPSMYKLGVILMRGYCGYPVSKREAVIWLQRACSTSMAPLAPGEDNTTIAGTEGVALPHALHALAMVQLTKECEETSMIPDSIYAIKLLHNAARLGYAPSQSKLGECYECGHFCPEDESQSIYWYTLAAKQGYPEACLALSGWYLTGSLKTNTLMQSDDEAYLWARKAASEAKSVHRFRSLTAKAYYILGMYHEKGIGVPKSIENSIKWYKKAANHGHVEALKLTQSQSSVIV